MRKLLSCQGTYNWLLIQILKLSNKINVYYENNILPLLPVYKRLKKINLNILCVDLLFMIYIVRQFSYCK